MAEQSEAGMATPVGSPPLDPQAAMRGELASILSSAEFSRAPIMKRLLAYLVDETASGRGDQLKAYAVAVDGLGRAPDYDARADSYPRVQVGRLRRMLAEHYARTAAAGRPRLEIPSGRYKVHLVTKVAAPVEADRAIASPPRVAWPMLGLQTGLVMLVMLLATVAIAMLMPVRAPATPHGKPMLELTSAVPAGTDPDVESVVRAALLDGLRRSPIFEVRAARRTGAPDPRPIAASYRLATEYSGNHMRQLQVRLWKLAPDRLLWSASIVLPADGRDEEIVRALAPAIATISRVDGLVSQSEFAQVGAHGSGSYDCLLLYHRFRRERLQEDRPAVERCLRQGIASDEEDASLHAAAAELALSNLTPLSDRDRATALVAAQRDAQLATTIDPLNAWANMVQARVSMTAGACPRAVRIATRASELDPYDPALLSDTAMVLVSCGDPRAEPVVRRAIALDDNPDGRFYQPLVLLAIERGDPALARDALSRMTPPVIGRRPRFYLIAAAGYAMAGDAGRARAAWTRLAAIDPKIVGAPGKFLEAMGISPELRGKAIGHLRTAGLI